MSPSGSDCTRLPEAGLCSLTALEAALSRRDLELKAQPGYLSPSPSPASDLYRAAVYEEFDAGDETGIFGGQEKRDSGNLARLSDATHGNQR
jgi:hypothetical protein